jgi:hypothetical protein
VRVITASIQPGGLLFVLIGGAIITLSRYSVGLERDLTRRIGGTPSGAGRLWMVRVLGAILIIWGLAIFITGK